MSQSRRFVIGETPQGAWESVDASVDSPYIGEKFTKDTDSQQVDPNEQVETGRKWVRPPYDPWKLALLSERSETRAACVSSKSKATAGHGFSIAPHSNADEPDPEGEARKKVDSFWFDGKFQLGPDRVPSTSVRLLRIAQEDYQGIGWLSLEVLRNTSNMVPSGMAHIPAHTVRRRRGATGYVTLNSSGQIDGYFAAAGDGYGADKKFVNKKTGDVGSTVASIGGPDSVANELLVMHNYSPLWAYYGTPDDIPALETIAGDIAARKYNTTFFNNDTIPRFAVMVEGGELTDRAYDELEKTFKSMSDPEDSHRAVIIEALADVKDDWDNTDVSITIEPLTVGIEEDSSFKDFRKDNRRDILRAHNVPPVIAGDTDSVNYANAKQQRQEFAQDEIQPLQRNYAEHFYHLIHVEMLDVPEWSIEFALRNAEDRQREAEIAGSRIEGSAGSFTIREARAEFGYGPITNDSGDELPVNDMLVADVSRAGSGSGAFNQSAGGYSITRRVRNE